jgi:hypothetical protein
MFTKITRTASLGALAVAALAVTVPGSVTAAPYTVAGPANSYSASVSKNSGSSFSNTSAGPFTLTDVDTNATLASFIAWCFDLDNTVSTNGTQYSYSTTPYLDGGALARVQSVFDANYSTSFPTSLPDTAALQLAIWDAIYDDDFDIDAGTFQAASTTPSNTSPTILVKAQTFLDAAKVDNKFNDKWVITQLNGTGAKPDGTNAQGLGYATAVPLPAAAWLLLGVSGALVGAKRRKKRIAAA